MIFKSEQPNIKRISSEEVAPKEDQSTKPYDVRKDFTKEDETSRLERLRSARERLSWDTYISLAVMSKALGKPQDAPLTPSERQSLLTMAKVWIKEPEMAKITGFHQYHTMMLALFDSSIFDELPPETQTLLHARVESIDAEPAENLRIAIENEAAKKVLAPERYVPILTLERLAQLFVPIDAKEEFMRLLRLKTLALARIANPSIQIDLHENDWKSIRSAIAANRRLSPGMHLDSIFYAQVLAAKNITIDSQGLHIELPEQDTPQSEQKPVPTPRTL